MNCNIIIRTATHGVLFHFKIYQSAAPEDLQIEDTFYLKHSPRKSLPEGTHYEIEVQRPNLIIHEHVGKVHLHASEKNKKQFICWTDQITDTDKLKQIMLMWSQGTAFTMETGDDFLNLFEKHEISPDDISGMSNLLEKTYKMFPAHLKLSSQ